MMDDGRRGSTDQGDRRMGLTVALIATLALAASADATAGRGRLARPFRRALRPGRFPRRARSRRACARCSTHRIPGPATPGSARWPPSIPTPRAARCPASQDPEALKAFPEEDRARLETALGYLCLDLGIEPLAAMYFERSPGLDREPSARRRPGLAILAVRRGNSRQALVHFDAARATVRQDPSLAELERDTRYDVVLHEFATARDLRDANAAGRAYSVLDELRPSHPATLQARADLAQPARRHARARTRAARPAGRGPEGARRREPARRHAARAESPVRRLRRRARHGAGAARRATPACRRSSATGSRTSRSPSTAAGATAQTDHDRLGSAAACRSPGPAALRTGAGSGVLAEAAYPESDRVPGRRAVRHFRRAAGARPIRSPTRASAGLVQWAPRNGLVARARHDADLVRGQQPHRSAALPVRVRRTAPWACGVDRTPVEDSLLSYAGTVDPLSGRTWGGVVRNRAYLGGNFGDDDFDAVRPRSPPPTLDGHRVDNNTEWRADAGFLQRAASGTGLGRARRRHGRGPRLFAPTGRTSRSGTAATSARSKFLSVGPVFELAGRREDRSFRLEGGVAWQEVREESSDFFPTDAALQAGERRSALSGRLTRRHRAAARGVDRMARHGTGRRRRPARGRARRGRRRGAPAGLRAPLGPRGDRARPAAARAVPGRTPTILN